MNIQYRRTNPFMGKVASNEKIQANINTLVQLDMQYQVLKSARDRDGLIALSQAARAVNQTSVARKAQIAALELRCSNG